MTLTITKTKRVPAHSALIVHAEYSHDASMFATASQDKTVIIWDVIVHMHVINTSSVIDVDQTVHADPSSRCKLFCLASVSFAAIELLCGSHLYLGRSGIIQCTEKMYARQASVFFHWILVVIPRLGSQMEIISYVAVHLLMVGAWKFMHQLILWIHGD
jgi:hypothetical protein